MKAHPKSLLVLLVALISFSCSDKDKVNIENSNLNSEVSTDIRPFIEFDKPLVSDTLVNVWLEEGYIEFDPPIIGKFKWRSSTVLEFFPQQPLLPATNYKATLSKKLLDQYNYKGFNEEELNFHTPNLYLENIQAYWEKSEENESAEIHVKLRFNYTVDLEKTGEFLDIQIDGQTMDFRAERNDEREIELIINSIPTEDKDLQIAVTLKSGSIPSRGSIATNENQISGTELLSPFKINALGLTADHNGITGTARVQFTQSISTKNLNEFIEIDPAVNFTANVDGQEVLISSEEFDMSKSYKVTVKEGLSGALGGTLNYEYSDQVVFGELAPQIKFTNRKARYLSTKGNKNVEIQIINVPKVQLKVTKVYENNILSFLERGYFGSYYNDQYYDQYYTGDNVHAGNLGDVVYEKEIVSSELPSYGSLRILNIDFEDKLSLYDGLYIIEVSDKEDYWNKASKIIALSDIGLIVKKGKNNITVFANSIKTAKPIAGVELSLIGRNNQKVGTITTNNEGVAAWSSNALPAANFDINMITAKKDRDFNYIAFDNTSIQSGRFDVGGKRNNNSGFEAYLYGERNIYRPGETINLAAIVRTSELANPEPLPVKIKLTTSRGQEFKTIRKTLNEEGATDASFDLPTTAMTGTYLAELFTSNNVLLNRMSIAVEEFVPDRIKTEIDVMPEDPKPGDNVTISVKAENFFGPPAANRNFEVDRSIKRKYFSAKGFEDYNFSLSNNETNFRNELVEGKTNSEGIGNAKFEIPQTYANMGLLQYDFFTTVFDETGRPVNNLKSVEVSTQDIYLGLKQESGYQRANQPVSVGIISLNRSGNIVESPAKIKLIRHEYRTVLSRSGNYFRYNSEPEEILLEEKELTIRGSQQQFTFVPEISGRYELRVSLRGASNYVSSTFYCYGWGSTNNSSFQVNNEGQIDIRFDKEVYAPGDKARVLVTSPFSGKILVTLESDRVIKHFYIQSDKKSASFDLDINADLIPNAYVTATIFRPHEQSELPLTVAHGFAPIMVENKANRIPVKITAADKSRSKRTQKIKVKTKPHAFLSLAVVDEGILQVTRFESPDPYDYFYQKRALEVSSYNVYPYLFPEIESRSGMRGGGEMMTQRLNPLQNKRFKLVSAWSGIQQANELGEYTYEMKIPEFSGDLRVMVVAFQGKQFNGISENIKVADPIVLSTAFPRFLSPGDSISVPLTITNTTKTAGSASINLSTKGPILSSFSSADIKINANSENNLQLNFTAAMDLGETDVKITANALGETFSQEIQSVVRPASPLEKRNGLGKVRGGENVDIQLDTDDFMNNNFSYQLIISNSPLVNLSGKLQDLIQYPHGCIEQTISRVFPQLYLPELTAGIISSKNNEVEIRNNINAAIRKLKLMQLYNGAFTYWPGSGEENFWSSVYATHFLYEARTAGYDVDEQILNKAAEYLKMRLKKRELINYSYSASNNQKIVPREIAYALFTLSLMNQPQRSDMNYYKANRDILSNDSRYMLAAAFALSGDRKSFGDILPQKINTENREKENAGSFSSPVRDLAISLYTLIIADPDHLQIPELVNMLSSDFSNTRYLNTQEMVFSTLALGKFAKLNPAKPVKATVKIGEKVLGTYEKGIEKFSGKSISADGLNISAEGEGTLYFFWETQGISKSGNILLEDNYIAVNRKYYTRNGKLISNNLFQQNDLIVVAITLRSLSSRTVENIAISDLLPAGFEIENARLSDVTKLHWIKNKSIPEYEDIRDDRMNIYDTATNKSKTYYYMVRAITKGRFKLAPIAADAMYNGAIHSYSGGGMVIIK